MNKNSGGFTVEENINEFNLGDEEEKGAKDED